MKENEGERKGMTHFLNQQLASECSGGGEIEYWFSAKSALLNAGFASHNNKKEKSYSWHKLCLFEQ